MLLSAAGLGHPGELQQEYFRLFKAALAPRMLAIRYLFETSNNVFGEYTGVFSTHIHGIFVGGAPKVASPKLRAEP